MPFDELPSSRDGAGNYKVVEATPTGPYKDEEDQKYPWGPYTDKKAYGQVTIRFPLNKAPRNLIALAYGFLPWLLPILFVVYGVATWHFLPLYGVAMSIICALINEAILKPILGQPRPACTAHRDKEGKPKNGMPSGHVLNATTIMVWACLEVALKGPGLAEGQGLTISWLVIILLLMAPVPWARWHNWDHTLNQTLVSLVLGTVAGIAAFYLRITFFSHPWKPWEEGSNPAMSKVIGWRPGWVPAVSTTTPDSGKSLLLL
jgi:hypothetical protein